MVGNTKLPESFGTFDRNTWKTLNTEPNTATVCKLHESESALSILMFRLVTNLEPTPITRGLRSSVESSCKVTALSPLTPAPVTVL